MTDTPTSSLKLADRHEQMRQIAECLINGLKADEISEKLNLERGTIRRWMIDSFDEMKAMIRGAAERIAVLELPESVLTLIRLRDQSENDETRRKACADLMRFAGVPNDPGAAPTSITVNATNAQINLSTSELDRKIQLIADKLGGEAVKLVKSELHGVRGISSDGNEKSGAGQAGSARAEGSDQGEAKKAG